MSNFEIGGHNPQPMPEPNYGEVCPMCAQGNLWGLWLSPNGNYWHSVDGYPQHRCKADGVRKAYIEYRRKFISAPTIIIPED